jgi:taurine dioxygenase
LPEDLRALIRNRRAVHAYAHPAEWYDVQSRRRVKEPGDAEMSRPIEFSHPRTGEAVLFVNDLLTREVEGMGPEESLQLLDRLCEHLYAHDHRYEHQWRIDDIVVWDNLALQHARTDDALGEPRTLRRISLCARGLSELMPEATEALLERIGNHGRPG